jgi:hypothetical protein
MQTATQYSARFVHKISPKDTDVQGPFGIPDGAFSDSKKLGAALRSAKILGKGERIRAFRVEGDKVVVFPCASIWHAIVITAAPEEREERIAEVQASLGPLVDTGSAPLLRLT